MKPRPPAKRPGQATGRRRFNGAVVDVAGIAKFLGETEKQTRAQVSRRLLPYRRLGSRIVFIVEEVQEYLRALPGVTVEEALRNVAARNGHEARPDSKEPAAQS